MDHLGHSELATHLQKYEGRVVLEEAVPKTNQDAVQFAQNKARPLLNAQQHKSSTPHLVFLEWLVK